MIFVDNYFKSFMSPQSYANFKTLSKFRQFEYFLELRFESQFEKMDNYFRIKYHDDKAMLFTYFDFTLSKAIRHFIFYKILDFLGFLIELYIAAFMLILPFLVILLIFLEIYS